MPQFGIIGHPVSGSMSPRLFAAAYAGRYPYSLIEGADFDASWARFLADYQAINVTAPFKERACAAVEKSGGRVLGPAARIGAANLVVKGPEGLEAYNSDFSGILLSVAEAYFPGVTAACYARYGDRGYIKVHQFVREQLPTLFPEAPQALVVGCGGAGRAAATAAAELGFGVALMNRTPEKARSLAESLPEYGMLAVPMTDFRAALRECDLVIYTVPEPIETLRLLTEADFAGQQAYGGAPSKVVLEANYKQPAFSGALLQCLQEAGAQYVPGKRWLLYQALTGYALMTGEVPDMTALLKINF